MSDRPDRYEGIPEPPPFDPDPNLITYIEAGNDPQVSWWRRLWRSR